MNQKIHRARFFPQFATLVFLFHLPVPQLLGQDDKATKIGERQTIHSDILDQDRDFLIYLPNSYSEDRYLPKSYPVLFLMDGDAHFQYTSSKLEYMGGMAGQIPEIIVVAVPHTNRTKELTPTNSILSFQGKPTDSWKDSGGADEFLKFLTEELVPHVDKTYRTRDYRILAGHSFGGLFAAHAYVAGNHSFQAFLLVDPSLWWDDRTMVKRLNEAIDSGALPKKKSAIFIAQAERPKVEHDDEDQQHGVENHFGGINVFASALESVPNTRTRIQPLAGESHGSIPIQTLYHGLLHIFEGFQPPTEMFLKEPDKLADHFKTVSERIGIEFLPDEKSLDQMGLSMLVQEDFRPNAVRLLRINLANYPKSANVHASLATAWSRTQKSNRLESCSTKHWNWTRITR